MSKTIDERVVEMRFDNKHFENNVRTTMSTLDKLKQSLNLKDSSKSFENLSTSARKLNLSPISSAVETVSVKFSALEVVGLSVLNNIANSAYYAGKRIVSSLTVDPISTGFQEYETQINSVQTILANTESKGSTLKDVMAALDELNRYADMTIYNFTEMTRNIGTFTAAGVDLETSVSAIKGIANLAAVSGSTSQQASTAMYQLSQALASGTVKLMDWNSVVNAGMGGQVFQDALKETARVHGIAIDEMIKNEGSFRDTLTKGEWLTSEILTETLAKFTGDLSEEQLKSIGYTDEQVKSIMKLGQTANDAATKVKTFTQLFDTLKEAAQSGWTQTWTTILGDFEEAKALFTELSDGLSSIINASSESRNSLISGAFDSSWGQLEKQIVSAGLASEDFQNGLIATAKAHGIEIDKMIKKEGSFEKTLKNGWLTSGIITETLNKFIGVEKEVGTTTKAVTTSLEELQSIANKVIKGEFGSGESRIKALTKAGYDYATVQNLVNEKLGNTKRHVTEMSDAELKNIGYTDEQVKSLRALAKQAEETGTPLNELIENLSKPSGRDLFIDSFRNAFKGIYKSITAVGTAWRNLFPKMTSNELYNIIDSIHQFSEYLVISDENADKLRRTFEGVFSIIKLFTTFTGGALSIGLKLVSRLLGVVDLNILDVTASIGDMIVRFKDLILNNSVINSGFDKLAKALISSVKHIRSWINSFMSLPIVQKNISRFGDAFYKTLINVYKYMKDGVDIVGDFIDSFKDMDKLTLEDIAKAFSVLKDRVVKHLSNFRGVFSDTINAVTKFKMEVTSGLLSVGDGFGVVKNIIADFVNFVRDRFGSIGLGEILTITLAGSLIVFIKKITSIGKVLAGPMEAITGFFSSLTNAVDEFAKAKAFQTKSKGILNIAIAVGILATSLVILSKIDQDRLVQSSVVLIGLAGGLLAISVAMEKLNKLGGFSKGSLGLMTLSTSVMILVSSLKSVDELDSGKILSSLSIIGALTAGLVTASIILTKAAPQLSTSSIGLLMMAASLRVLIKTMNDFKDIETGNTSKTITTLLAAVAGLILVSKACQGVSLRSSIGVMALVVSLKTFVGVIEDIAKIELSDIQRNLGSFIAIFASLSLVMASTSLAGKHALQGGIAMMAISTSLLLIIQAVKMVANIDRSTLSNATRTITGLLQVFALMVAVTSLAGKNAMKAGVMLLMMSGAFVLLTGVMVILSKIDPSGLDRAVSAIQTVSLCFALLIASTKLMEKSGKKSLSTMTKMIMSISILSLSLGALSMIKPENLKTATIALSSVMAMFALMVASTSMLKGSNSTLLIMVGIVGGLATMLHMLSDLQVDNAIGIATSLSMLMTAMSITALLISKVPISGALTGVASLAILIAGIAAIVVAFGALSKIDGVNDLLSSGGETLMLIGNAIGSFVGGIAGGFISGTTSGLPSMANHLSKFMTNLQPFLEGCKQIDESTISVVGKLAVAMLAITAAEVLDGLAGLLGFGDMSSFGDKLSTFAKGLVEFSDIVKGKVDANAVEAAANAGMIVTELARSIPNSGGWLGAIMGENDIDTFGLRLKELAKGLVDFSSVVKGKIDVASVEAATNAGQMIAALSNEIPNTGGWLGAIMGENDVDIFGSKLKGLAVGLVDFSSVVKGKIDVSSVEAATNAGKLVAELSQEIPNTGGLLGLLSGDNDVDIFGAKLKMFGQGLVDFSNVVSGNINTTSVDAATNSGKMLVGLANELKDGSIWDIFTGKSIDEFGQDLVIFGEYFSSYAEKMKGVDSDTLNTTTSAADSIVKLANAIPDKGGWFSDNTTLDDFGKMLSKYGTYFSDFNSTISNVDTSHISDMIAQTYSLIRMVNSMDGIDTNGCENFGYALKNTAEYGISVFVRTFDESGTDVANSANKMCTTFVEAINNSKTRIKDVFKDVCDSIVDTFKSRYTDFTTEGQNAVNCLVVGIQRSYNDMYEAGNYAIKGFMNGVKSNLRQAYQVGHDIGDAAKRGAERSLDEHSPSKEFYRIGDFAGIGFVNALGEYSSKAYKSGARMADAAKNGLGETLTNMSSVLSGDIDTQPTIRPVLDLTNIKSGAGELNTLFSRNRTLSISTGVGGRIVTNNANDDVVDAINGLRRQINNLSNTTYQINGITYDDGSNISGAVQSLIRATRIERRS